MLETAHLKLTYAQWADEKLPVLALMSRLLREHPLAPQPALESPGAAAASTSSTAAQGTSAAVAPSTNAGQSASAGLQHGQTPNDPSSAANSRPPRIDLVTAGGVSHASPAASAQSSSTEALRASTPRQALAEAGKSALPNKVCPSDQGQCGMQHVPQVDVSKASQRWWPTPPEGVWHSIEEVALRALVTLDWAVNIFNESPAGTAESHVRGEEDRLKQQKAASKLAQQLVRVLQQLLANHLLDKSLDMGRLFEAGLRPVLLAQLGMKVDCTGLWVPMLQRLAVDPGLVPTGNRTPQWQLKTTSNAMYMLLCKHPSLALLPHTPASSIACLRNLTMWQEVV